MGHSRHHTSGGKAATSSQVCAASSLRAHVAECHRYHVMNLDHALEGRIMRHEFPHLEVEQMC